jgi:hypothetical protein
MFSQVSIVMIYVKVLPETYIANIQRRIDASLWLIARRARVRNGDLYFATLT